MTEENNTGSNVIWAIAMILITVIIAGAIYFTVMEAKKPSKMDADIEIKIPTSTR